MARQYRSNVREAIAAIETLGERQATNAVDPSAQHRESGPSAKEYPIQLNAEQEQAAKDWAADDRLWTTQETVEFNLRTFARRILSLSAVAASLREPPQAPWEPMAEAVEEFIGWWSLNREGSVNRTYDYIDKLAKRLRAALPPLPLPSPPASAPAPPQTTNDDDLTRVDGVPSDRPLGSTASDVTESFDARDWAKAFCDIYEQRHGSRPDEEWLVTWFANALMRGWDEHARRYPTDALIHQVGLFDSTPLVSQPHFDACNAIFMEALKLGRPHVDHDAPEYRRVVPPSIGAVDPYDGVVEGCPRATESLSSLTVAAAPAPKEEA